MCVNQESEAYITDKKTLKMIYIQGVPKMPPELKNVSKNKRAYSKTHA
jgi:hypothetical protein